MSRTKTALAKTSGAALLAAAFGLALMALVIGWQVFGRKVLNASPAWSESLALLLMLYFVLLAAAAGVQEDFHLRFRLLDNLLPEKIVRRLQQFANLIVAGFGVLMAIHGAELAQFTSSHVIPTLGVSRAVAYWPFVFTGILITVFAVARVIRPIDDSSEAD